MGGGKGDLSEAARDAREMGAPEEIIAQLEADDHDGEFEVWPDNWEALVAFIAVSTQWRTASISGRAGSQLYWQGLDYTAAQAGLAGADIAVNPDLWRGLQVMEAAARNALNGIREGD